MQFYSKLYSPLGVWTAHLFPKDNNVFKNLTPQPNLSSYLIHYPINDEHVDVCWFCTEVIFSKKSCD